MRVLGGRRVDEQQGDCPGRSEPDEGVSAPEEEQGADHAGEDGGDGKQQGDPRQPDEQLLRVTGDDHEPAHGQRTGCRAGDECSAAEVVGEVLVPTPTGLPVRYIAAG